MSADRELGRRLRELRAPEEREAEERSWDVVRAAYAERATARPEHRARRIALVAAAGAAVLVIGLSPAGAEVGDLVSDITGIGEEDAKPELRSLPAAGELLVESGANVWVVRDDGSKRLLGEYGDASWSPNGLYVAATRGRELLALEPDGAVRWTYPAPGAVRDPRWAGTELDTRIAYRSGADLRVIAGDGDPDTDRLIARDVAPVAPAWRPVGESKLEPGAGSYVLAYVDRGGEVRIVNAETGRRLPTTAADVERLATLPDRPGPRRARSPDGTEVATLESVGGRDRLAISHDGGDGRVVFAAPGRLTGPSWSPDGRWVLVGWPAADQWIFIEVGRPRHVVPFGRISEQFDPGGATSGAFPRVVGWELGG